MFILFRHEEVREMVAESDHMVAECNQKDKIDIEILKDKVDESNVDICYVAFAESDDDEEKRIKKWLSV